MTTILFDIITGISGDMTIGALLNAGADFNHLKNEINKLGLQGFELTLSSIKRSYITAVKFDVKIQNQPHYHTHLKGIFELIDKSSLSDLVKHTSEKIFGVIGTAEAKIHNVPIEQIHFHEVGAIDSIVDIVGTCICLEYLGVERVYTTPVKLGKGQINTQHGIMPNPAPATLEILKNYPVNFTNIDYELTTPTGAAIVKTLSSGIYDNDSLGDVKIRKIGFGSGTYDIKESPNLLRVILCEVSEPSKLNIEKLVIIETNIDDMNPQVYPYVMEKLFEAGANDVYYYSVMMKKGRPGILLSVLTTESMIDKMLEIIYSETTTIGVRINRTDRHKLKREIKEIDTSLGKVKVKITLITNGFIPNKKITPEFEDCKRLAKELKKPLNDIYNLLMRELNGPTLSFPLGKTGGVDE
jgi:uncharacterized protein (TIGR00299 family) protein